MVVPLHDECAAAYKHIAQDGGAQSLNATYKACIAIDRAVLLDAVGAVSGDQCHVDTSAIVAAVPPTDGCEHTHETMLRANVDIP